MGGQDAVMRQRNKEVDNEKVLLPGQEKLAVA
jgi:hypothetical protein